MIENITNILDWAIYQYQQVDRYYSEQRKADDIARTKIIKYYLSSHAMNLSSTLNNTEIQKKRSEIDKLYFDYVIKNPELTNTIYIPDTSKNSVNRLVSDIFERHQNICLLYQHISARISSEIASSMFTGLANMDNHETRCMVKLALYPYNQTIRFP